MRSSWRVLGVALPVALLLACNDQATAPEANTPAITADFMNNPEPGPWPWVARYEFGLWVNHWSSPDGLVRAIHTTFPLSGTQPFATWGWDDAICGPPGMGVMHLQEISHWDPTHWEDPMAVWIENGIAEVWIVLVSRAPGATGPCGGRPVIASGWGRLHYNDNNGTGLGRPQDAWSYRAEGRLTTPAGETVQYNGHLTCIFNKKKSDCNTLVNF